MGSLPAVVLLLCVGMPAQCTIALILALGRGEAVEIPDRAFVCINQLPMNCRL